MQNKNPLVSVIMNCYNSDEFLKEAIDSVFAQTYENWEIIFWDNQSTDNSAEIVNSYKDVRIKYFYAPNFTPLYAARNYAIEKSSGEFIAFLDCDDKWCKDKLQIQVEAMVSGDFGFCYTNYYEIRGDKNIKAFCKKQPSGDIFKYQIANYSIGILTVLLSRSAWDNMDEKFDSNFTYPGDYDFFIRLLFKQKALYIDESLAFYRVSNPNSISNIKKYSNISEIKECVRRLKLKFSDTCDLAFDIYLSKICIVESIWYMRDKRFKDAFFTLTDFGIKKLLNFEILLWFFSKISKKFFK